MIEQGGGTVEYRFRHRKGHYVWIQDTFTVMRDAAGQPAEIVGSWADISDRKRAEQALGERWSAMQDLQTLVAASPSVIYTNQASGNFACTFVSENLQSIMGYAPWEMRDDTNFWSKRLHPEDAPRVFAELARLVDHGGGSVEYRFRHRRGHYVWIQDTFTVMRDDSGKPKELVGSWADISDRKKVEAELQRLAAQVELRNRFIRETFGRYLTDEVVANLLDSPTGQKLGGEKRKITMMMSDLRGFTSLSERLAPERVVSLLNRYLVTWSPSSRSTRARSTSSSVTRSSSSSGLRSGTRTMRSGRWPAPWRCNWAWPRSMNRTERKACPIWRWASESTPVKWSWGISARPSG